MAKSKKPIVIKKYRHRRLYRASDRAFTTLEELAKMAKSGEDFIVYNVETREDITRSVLTQIILEQAIKDGQNPLPLKVLRQLISFLWRQYEETGATLSRSLDRSACPRAEEIS